MNISIAGLCTGCRAVLAGHMDAESGRPSIPVAGDVSLCSVCGTFNTWTVTPMGLGLRRIHENEREKIKRDFGI